MPCLKTSFDSEAPIAEETSRSQRELHVEDQQQVRDYRKFALPVVVVGCRWLRGFLVWSLGQNQLGWPAEPPKQSCTVNDVATISTDPLTVPDKLIFFI
jgi:hypothetical protein